MKLGIEANSCVSSQSPSTTTALERRVPLSEGLDEHAHILNSRGVTSG